jgi:hypothetical protein
MQPNPLKRASALVKRGSVYIPSYSETTVGVWIGDGPVFVAGAEEPAQVGRYVRDALTYSRRGIRHRAQTEWKAVQAPMLRATGARSRGAMAKGSKAVALECDPDMIVTMIPSANYENPGGTALYDGAIKAELSADDIGEKLIAAFDASS